MKMKWKAGLIVILPVIVLIAILIHGAVLRPETAKKTSMRIGTLLYRRDDTFINTLRAALEESAKEYE